MKISVQKYNPSVDAEPYFGTYEIEQGHVLGVLDLVCTEIRLGVNRGIVLLHADLHSASL